MILKHPAWDTSYLYLLQQRPLPIALVNVFNDYCHRLHLHARPFNEGRQAALNFFDLSSPVLPHFH
ncbi:protein of unknown function [Candidatus Methylomirabilis oxygeniifera]|uniref:Uncharacterized protein n=1 Tax=Methylomirabilis oxygeniifera TaxID=671143 RepID=D5MF63_METO1|nr:protein of unknown function [Candidatus Methylomirabilis oxyfera]